MRYEYTTRTIHSLCGRADVIKIAERFMSIQGEGRYAGFPAYFIRLSGCNFLCNWLKKDGTREFCDTVEVWKTTKEETTPENLMQAIFSECKQIKYFSDLHIIITGGEPALQKEEITKFIELGKQKNMFFELETNGSIKDLEFYKQFNQINWSPKFKSAGYGLKYYERSGALDFWKENFQNLPVDIKIVIANENDFIELEKWLDIFAPLAKHGQIMLMPVCNTREEHEENSRWLVEKCKEIGLPYSPRLHLMLWNKAVGV